MSCNKVTESQREGYTLITQSAGPDLGYSSESGLKTMKSGGKVFKDLNRNGVLDPYEDWRKTPEERTADLVGRLSKEDMAGLMLCSHMQSLPGTDINHYGGLSFSKNPNARPWQMTDEQKSFLKNDLCRSILLAGAKGKETIVKWNNNVQAYVEGDRLGIPVNILSDPRHHAASDMEFLAGSGGDISMWPNYLGMAATFDPALEEEFGRIASSEYRALGITVALSPQADLPGEPRWWRFDGTFGESPVLVSDMVRAYCDGFQTSEGKDYIKGPWGPQSVVTMAKHWYGYGAQEGGREAHFSSGAYGVFPAGNLETFRKTFVDGALHLQRGTGESAAIMTNYSILWDQDPSGENVACSYSDYVVNQQLRKAEGYDGVICTDWDVFYDYDGMMVSPGGYMHNGKSYGVEDLSVGQRHYRILLAGVDQFGGANFAGPVLEAYDIWAANHGEESADRRFRESARRILLNMFRVGVFENPYSDIEVAAEAVGSPEAMAKGYQAQLKSVVMLKNNGALPASKELKAYFPKRHFPAIPSVWGGASEDKVDFPIDSATVARYFPLAATPSDADFALVVINGPALMVGYDKADVEAGGNGYVPVSLQYEDYTADLAREVSIAGGSAHEDFTNRSYKGKTVHTLNRDDMLLVRETKAAMGDKPVIVCINIDKPLVLSEIEPWADAILLGFGIQKQALLDIISGGFEPSGLLPMQLPADMETVETQMEDKTLDMRCYTDSEGHVYDLGYGMDWSGVISDDRTAKYTR